MAGGSWVLSITTQLLAICCFCLSSAVLMQVFTLLGLFGCVLVFNDFVLCLLGIRSVLVRGLIGLH